MQPYQEATQEIQRQGELPFKIGKTAANIAASAAGAYYGGELISKVAPWLSKYIPVDLMKKGLSKVHPGFGKFIDKSLAAGQTADKIKEFIGQKMEESQTKNKENRNIIEQESPELHQFLDQEIRGGRNPIEAGALAQNDKRFSSIIQKLMKVHKTPWSNIIQSIFGNGQTAQSNQQQEQNAGQGQQTGNSSDDELFARFQNVLKM